MYEHEFETLIIGASFYGMALGKTLGSDALLIERGYRIGEEYSSSLRVSVSDFETTTQMGRDFLEAVKKHSLIDENGFVYSTPSAYLLAELIGKINALFATEILSVKRIGDVYEVTVFNSAGRGKICVKRIIDTVTLSEGDKKQLNVIVRNPRDKEAVYDRFTKSYVYSFPADINESFSDVRKRLFDFLIENPALGAVHIADCFDAEIKNKITKKDIDYYIIPSLGFGNPISAVDAGGGGLLV